MPTIVIFRRVTRTSVAIFWLLITLLTSSFTQAASSPEPQTVIDSMKRATEFMVEKVSYRGGYLWAYLPDFSRQWGELEANRTMIWMQPPGTATMGHIFLDAYHATQDEYYYQAAEQVAGAIIWAQHPSGGWNYLADFAGEAALRDWYATVGKNAWRLEEFQHYYGNATFDDGSTSDAAKFLLRLYMEKLDAKYRPALQQAINFVIDSQYPIGGWPQRYPLRYDNPSKDQPDYTAFITFNDDVAQENIEFLLMCYQALGEERVREPIIRAMNTLLVLQQGQPQPGWGLQYTLDLQPAGARSYEPSSLSSTATQDNIRQLIDYYHFTGDTKFLARIPEALDWLDSIALPKHQIKDGRTHPGFIEVGTGKALYTHRRGSNIVNGEYYVDYTLGNELRHYRSTRIINVPELRKLYEQAKQTKPDDVVKNSPLKAKQLIPLPKYHMQDNLNLSDLNTRALVSQTQESLSNQVSRLQKELNTDGYWPTPIRYMTHPYRGPGPSKPTPGNFANTMVGDQWDTSPYPVDTPPMGISTGAYIKNMTVLIEYLTQPKAAN